MIQICICLSLNMIQLFILQIQIFQLSHELAYLSDWFQANQLSLNISKTNYIIFSNTEKQSKLKLADQVISKVGFCQIPRGTY